MANFDSTQWYQITLKSYGLTKPVLSLASNDQATNGSSSVFFQTSNTTKPNQKWQLFPAKNNAYIMRTQESGPYGYLTASAEAGKTATANTGNTIPMTANYMNITDNSMYWTVKPWPDGSFFFQNGANGTSWHLEVEKNALMSMSSNITGTQDGQKFIFKSLGTITTKSFSTINVRRYYWSTLSLTNVFLAPTLLDVIIKTIADIDHITFVLVYLIRVITGSHSRNWCCCRRLRSPVYSSRCPTLLSPPEKPTSIFEQQHWLCCHEPGYHGSKSSRSVEFQSTV